MSGAHASRVSFPYERETTSLRSENTDLQLQGGHESGLCVDVGCCRKLRNNSPMRRLASAIGSNGTDPSVDRTISMKAKLIFSCLMLLSGAAIAQENATAIFVDLHGAENGKATLTETADGVLVDLEVKGLPAGRWVAFHVHETGACDHTTRHESAGAHFNPGNAEHGYLSPKGPHAGDMPNQWVGEDGTLRAQVFNPMIRLSGGDNTVRGRALMIHGGIDDYRTQPSGAAGDRYACGIIK